jgi:hypothetical protein
MSDFESATGQSGHWCFERWSNYCRARERLASIRPDGGVIGRIFFLDAIGPQGRPWMWASGHNGDIKRAAHGYEPTREAAMAAFAKSW